MKENRILSGSPEAYLVMESPVEIDLDLIRKTLEIYTIVSDSKPRLTPSEMNLMIYYMKSGYSDETKEQYIEDTGMSESGVHVTNNKLRNKGYLVKSKSKHTISYLAPDIESIRESLYKGQAMNLVIKTYVKR